MEAAKSLSEAYLFYHQKVYDLQLAEANLEKLKILMEFKPIKDVNAVDKEGNSILMCLVRGAPLDSGILQELVALGADPHKQNNSNWTLLHQASLNPDPGVIDWLLELKIDTQVLNKYGKLIKKVQAVLQIL